MSLRSPDSDWRRCKSCLSGSCIPKLSSLCQECSSISQLILVQHISCTLVGPLPLPVYPFLAPWQKRKKWQLIKFSGKLFSKPVVIRVAWSSHSDLIWVFILFISPYIFFLVGLLLSVISSLWLTTAKRLQNHSKWVYRFLFFYF